jgi:hypothetical protein
MDISAEDDDDLTDDERRQEPRDGVRDTGGGVANEDMATISFSSCK